MATATLHYVEHVDNHAGNWTREWFATIADAEHRERELRSKYEREAGPFTLDRDCDGSYGDVSPANSITINLTLNGLLAFANDWATNTGEG